MTFSRFRGVILAAVLGVMLGGAGCGSSEEQAPPVPQEPIVGPWGQEVGGVIPEALVQEHASELEPAPEGPGQFRVVGTPFRLVPLEDGTYAIARDGFDRPSADR